MYGRANLLVKLPAIPKYDALALAGKKLLVVGGTGGIGRAIALAAAARGAAVTVVGRTFKDVGTPGLEFVKADLSSMVAARDLGKALAAADVIAFTTGTGPAPKREVTSEGIERDMATSALSRLVILREMWAKLPSGTRVFVWGMPGNGLPGVRADDLNAEGEGYEGNFGWVHVNTVAANEALAVEYANRGKTVGVSVFGMNPGLVPTGLRSFIYGDGFLAKVAESLIGLMNPSAEAYARTIVPLMFAPGLEQISGTMFGQKGTPILPDDAFADGGAAATKWHAAMERLAKEKAGL